MAKFEKQIEVFIQLRIEGNSFDDIASTLKTSKQTLIEWNKQMAVRDTIKDGKAIKINSVVKTYQFDVTNRLNGYLHLSKRINDELQQRDLKEIPTDTLLKMSIANDGRIKELVNKKVQLGTNESYYNLTDGGDGFFDLNLDE